MQFSSNERDRCLFQELDYENDCRDENQKSPTVAESVRTDEQPLYSAHPISTAPLLRRHDNFGADLNSACRRGESAPWQFRRVWAAAIADKCAPYRSRQRLRRRLPLQTSAK